MAVVACGLCLFLSGCAARRVTLPVDPGTPFPDFAQVHSQLSADCAGVRTMTAELGLSGRAGGQRLGGRAVAGFARPDSIRLEGIAPFGGPVFILAATGDAATLLLPRDDRVVRSRSAQEILGAMTGVALSPADLQAILTGCITPAPRATAGRLHQNGWASIDLDGGATAFLQMVNGGWQIRAARRSGWQIEYDGWQGSFPQTVRLRSEGQATEVDLSASVGQLETNVDIDPAAFTVNVPASAIDLTVEELRRAGPLRGQ